MNYNIKIWIAFSNNLHSGPKVIYVYLNRPGLGSVSIYKIIEIIDFQHVAVHIVVSRRASITFMSFCFVSSAFYHVPLLVPDGREEKKGSNSLYMSSSFGGRLSNIYHGRAEKVFSRRYRLQ